MLFNIFLFLALLYRLIVLILTLNGLYTLRISKLIRKKTGSCLNKYIFIFPIYLEQKIIIDTCRYYERFLRHNEITLIFVGDTSENKKPTSIELTKDYFKTAKSVYHLCMPYKGMKAAKVNYAIEKINEMMLKFDYLFVFDCDSRIDSDTFLDVDSYLNLTKIDIGSYIPIPVMNQSGSAISYCANLHRFERIAAFELGGSLLPDFMKYPMGAAMAISYKAITELKKIPEPIDDISLAYLATKFNLRKKNFPFFVISLPTINIRSYIRQHVPIFTGVFSVTRTIIQYGLHLSFTDRIKIYVSYIFYLLEFLSIGILPFLFINNMWMFFVLLIFFLLNIVLSLTCLNILTLRNVLQFIVGYPIRLLAFLNFAFKKVLPSTDLTSYKTVR